MGGAQRFLYEFITRLNSLEYEILVAAGLPAQAGGNGQLIEKLREKEIEVVSIKNFSNTPGLKNFLAFFETFNFIRKFKPDILYLLSSEAGFIGAIAGKLYRLLFWRKNPKIIYRIGGWAFKEPRNIFIKKIYLWAEKLSTPFKDVIITNSEFDRHLAIKNKIAKPEKIIKIYNGLDIDNLKFLSKEEAGKFIESKIPACAKVSTDRQTTNYQLQTTNLAVTIANFYKNKGLKFLILAIARISNDHKFNFVIIGDGPEKENLKNLIENHRLENKITLTGYIPDACRYLKAFDLFVLPSVKEGQPWTILEAMAAQTPIVATNIAGIPETIENEKSGLLIEPADPEALAGAIEKMLTHPSLAQECVKNALITVKEKFGIEEMVKRNEELFL